VKVELTKVKQNGRKEGKVKRIVKRKTRTFVGEIEMSDGFGFLVTRNDKLPDVYIDGKDLNGAQKGDKAVVKILSWGKKGKKPTGQVTSVLDKEDENDMAMKEILIENGFPLDFPKDVLDETAELKEDFSK